MISAVSLFHVLDALSSILGSLSSALLIFLILDMKLKSSYITLIYYMSIGMFVYFILIGFNSVYTTFYTRSTMWVLIIRSIAGVTSFFLSSILSFSILYVLKYYKVLNVFEWKKTCIACSFGMNIMWVPIVLAGAYANPLNISLMQAGFQVSTWLRVFPIVFNLIAYIASKILVSGMSSQRSSRNGPSKEEMAIIRLVDQMKWYPLVMAAARICVTWYSSYYGFSPYLSYDNEFKYGLYICYNLTACIAPVGFLIIFLVMQKKAWKHLKARLSGQKVASVEVKNDLKADSSNDLRSSKSAPRSKVDSAGTHEMGAVVAVCEGTNPMNHALDQNNKSGTTNGNSPIPGNILHRQQLPSYEGYDSDPDDDEYRVYEVNMVRESELARASGSCLRETEFTSSSGSDLRESNRISGISTFSASY